MAAVVLYDGECGVCAAAVRVVLARDTAGRFRFARQESDVGRALLAEHGVAAERGRTLVLVEDGRAWVRSEAVLRIAAHLRGTAWIAAAGRLLPRRWRDAVYDLAARHRRRVPDTRRPRCPVLTPEQRRRFLDP